MSSRSEEERAINNLGERIRAVEDALRDSHKLYKDIEQESHGYYSSGKLAVEVKGPDSDPGQARREQVLVQAIGEQTLIYVRRMQEAERFEALNYMRCCGRPWKLSRDIRG